MATPATQESGSAVISTTAQDDNRTPAEGEEGGATAVEANVDLARTVSSSVVKVKSEEADEKLSVAAAATDAADVGATTVTKNEGSQDNKSTAIDRTLLQSGGAAAHQKEGKNKTVDYSAAPPPLPQPAPATRSSAIINKEPPTVHRANVAHPTQELAANDFKAKDNIEVADNDTSRIAIAPVSPSTLAQQPKRGTPSKMNNEAPSSPPIVNIGIGHRKKLKQEEGNNHPLLVSATPGEENSVGSTPSTKLYVVASSSRGQAPKGSGGSAAESTTSETAPKAVAPSTKTNTTAKQHTISTLTTNDNSCNNNNNNNNIPPDDSISRTWSETIFPMKLYDILCNPDFHHAISWMPHGRSWRVINKEYFMAEICPRYFSQSRFESFIRQVNGWGFKRMRRDGPDQSSYYHEHFLRGYPNMIDHMRRPAPGEKNRDMREEPDFCAALPMPRLPPEDNKMMMAMAYQQQHQRQYPQQQQLGMKKVGRPAGSTGMRSAAGGMMMPPLPPESGGAGGSTRMTQGSFDAGTPRVDAVGGAAAEGGPGGVGGMAGYYMPYQVMPPMSPAYGGSHAGGGFQPHLGYPPPPIGYPGYPPMQPPQPSGAGGGVGQSPEYSYSGGPPESPWRQLPGSRGWPGGPGTTDTSTNAHSSGASSSSRGPGGVAGGGPGAPLPPHVGAMSMGYPWSPHLYGDPSQYYAYQQGLVGGTAAGGLPPTPKQRVLYGNGSVPQHGVRLGIKREHEDDGEAGGGGKRHSYEGGRGGGPPQHPLFLGSPTGGGGEGGQSDMPLGWYTYPGGGGGPPMMISDSHHHLFMMQSAVSAAATAEGRGGDPLSQGEEEGNGEQGTSGYSVH